VGQLEDAGLADLAVDGTAVRASLALPALLVDALANLGSTEVVEERAAELFQERPSLRLF